MKVGLGTQLRHIIELLDGAVAESYKNAGIDYRPRYTPVMKSLMILGTCTINELATNAGITQPAATQTVKLMMKADLILVTANEEDGRQKLIQLSAHGKSLLPTLQQCWQATNSAALSLDEELGVSFSEVLSDVIAALDKKPFLTRIEESKVQQD